MNSSLGYYRQTLQGQEVKSDEESEMQRSQESIEDEEKSLTVGEGEEKDINATKHARSHILNKATNRHSTQLEELVQDYKCGRDSQEIALIKAEYGTLPV